MGLFSFFAGRFGGGNNAEEIASILRAKESLADELSKRLSVSRHFENRSSKAIRKSLGDLGLILDNVRAIDELNTELDTKLRAAGSAGSKHSIALNSSVAELMRDADDLREAIPELNYHIRLGMLLERQGKDVVGLKEVKKVASCLQEMKFDVADAKQKIKEFSPDSVEE